MPRFTIKVLDEDLVFNTDADEERIAKAKSFVEDAYAGLNSRGGQGSRYGRNALLSLLILGIADDLLQSHSKLEEFAERVEKLLEQIGTK